MLLSKAFRLPVWLALPKLLLLFTLGLALLVLSAPVRAQTPPQTPIIDSTGGITDTGSSSNVTYGFDFTVTGSSLPITALGFFDSGSPGLTQSHDIGLWAANGTLLASTTIDNTATPVASTSTFGRWLKKDITPITLAPGSYVIGAFYLAYSPDLLTYGGATSSVSGTTLGNARFVSFGSGLSFPSTLSSKNNPGVFGPMAFTTNCNVPTGEQFQINTTTGRSSEDPPISGWFFSTPPPGVAEPWHGYNFVQKLLGGDFAGTTIKEFDAPGDSSNCSTLSGTLSPFLTGSPWDIHADNLFGDHVGYADKIIREVQASLGSGQSCSVISFQQMKIFCSVLNDYIAFGPVNRIEVRIFTNHITFSRSGVGATIPFR